MLASTILSAARRLLKDPGKVRWSDPALLGWLNAAQRMVVLVRPDAKSRRADLVLVDGIEQAIPADGIALLSVLHNINADATLGRAITLTTRDELNASNLYWTEATAKEAARQYLFDPDTPTLFEVTPPAIVGNKVRISYSVLPTDCATIASNIDVPDTYESPLVDLVCYRAYMEDSDDTNDGGRAANHLASAMQAMTGKAESDKAAYPKRK